MIKYGLSNRYKVDPYGTEEILSEVSNSVAPKLTIDYGDEVQEAEFTIRPTKGSLDTNISPIAILNSIKGNTVAWNQTFDVPQPYTSPTSYFSVTVTGKSCEFTIITVEGRTDTISISSSVTLQKTEGHVYYVSYNIKNQCAHQLNIRNGFTSWTSDKNMNVPANGDSRASFLSTCVKESAGNIQSIYFYYNGNQEIVIGDKFTISDIQTIDLTLIYGAGNEPSTAEAFEADYQKWFGKPLSYEAYDAGSLRPVKMSGIKTVGFNITQEQFSALGTNIAYTELIKVLPNTTYYVKNFGDAQTAIYSHEYSEDGTTEIKETRLGIAINEATFTTTTETYYVKIQWYNSNGISNIGKVVINLHHSGDRDGEYEPYRSSLLNVPITTMKGKLNGAGNSTVIFSGGMKSAGNVRDEIKIENNKLKGIKRVGTRPYEVGDVNSSTMTTDGINYTNYALATSEEYIIDDVNVEKVMLGNTEVTKVYLGNQLIFEESN